MRLRSVFHIELWRVDGCQLRCLFAHLQALRPKMVLHYRIACGRTVPRLRSPRHKRGVRRRLIARVSPERFGRMSDEGKLLTLTQKLLDSVASNDFSTYALLCAEDMTCFEPEAKGTLVQGQGFHKWYFDQHSNSTQPAKQNMCHPKVIFTPSVKFCTLCLCRPGPDVGSGGGCGDVYSFTAG